MRALLVLLAALFVGGAAEARSRGGSHSSSSTKSGPTCRKGKPCGNSCIAQSAVCHQPEGTAKAAGDDEKKPPPKTDDTK